MKALRVAWLAAVVPGLWAQTASVHDLVAAARQRIETADLRATGHLVYVEAGGQRITFPLTIKARWFPGILRVRVDIGQPSSAHTDLREHILLEMRPGGDNEIRIADPGDSSPRVVPFDKWNVHPLGPGFNHEDFLEPEYFWPGQTAEGKQKFGARDCEVVKSTPGPTDKTHYSEVKTWFDPSNAFPVYVEKTVKETGAVKEFTSYGIRHDEGVWSAHQIEEKVRGQAGSTLLIIDHGSPKANLTSNDFSPAQLARF
jgi:outer membrane lipoprotein-sorting protein